MNNCYCLIRHAVTPQERAQAAKNLEEARRNNDRVGILINMASLSQCPSMMENK